MRAAIKHSSRQSNIATRTRAPAPRKWSREKYFTPQHSFFSTEIDGSLLSSIGEDLFFSWLKGTVCKSANQLAYDYFKIATEQNFSDPKDKIYVANETMKLLFWKKAPHVIADLHKFAATINEFKDYYNHYLEFRLDHKFYSSCANASKIGVCLLNNIPKKSVFQGRILHDALPIGFATNRGIMSASAFQELPYHELAGIWSAIILHGIQSPKDLPDYYYTATAATALGKLLDLYLANLIATRDTRTIHPHKYQYQLSYLEFHSMKETMAQIENPHLQHLWKTYENEIKKCRYSITRSDISL